MENTNGQGFFEREEAWIQSNLERMTLEEKIGQMMIIRAYSKGDVAEKKYIAGIIEKYHIGGICFFQGDVTTQVQNTNYFQQISRVSLFIAIDAEWGVAMRHQTEALSFPKNLVLGAVQNEKLIYQLGKEIGKQCKALGVNFNFSPVADINVNPKNPVINERSFGGSRENVTSKAFLMFKGLEDVGVLSCAKHFPGHGDTQEDSHHVLPVLNHDMKRLEDVELFPFRRLAAQNIGSIMVGHLQLPHLDNRSNRPASLSKAIVTGLLRESMNYKGLILTDALDMKAITQYFPSGMAEAEAVLAGNDIILLSENVPLAIQTILKYINEGKIDEKQIDQSVYRILSAKYKLGLHVLPVISETGIKKALDTPMAKGLKENIHEHSLTLVKDSAKLLPIGQTKDINTATLSVHVAIKSTFQHRIDDYTHAHHYQLMMHQYKEKKVDLYNTLVQFDRVIIGIHSSIKSISSNRDLPYDFVEFLRELQQKTKVILVFFGSPYQIYRLSEFPTLLLAYDNDSVAQDMAAQAIFGAIPMSGKLPVEVEGQFTIGTGIQRATLGRLGYGMPERVGLNSRVLQGLDSLMSIMITTNATPGGQIVVAKEGKIVYSKEFGTLYASGPKVQKNTVYDVASLTKILSSTLGVMKLYDEQKISLRRPMRFYISDLIGTNKAEMILEDVMAHHAGLKPYISFYDQTMVKINKKIVPDSNLYKKTFSPDFSIPVAENMFLKADYRDSIWSKIFHSDLLSKRNYRYSDIGFYLVQKVIEEVSRSKLNDYVQQSFYDPLDLKFTGYKPLEKIPQAMIAPTEMDQYFRMSMIRGTVHDMGSAMLGGVAGHAGIFSTATETTILMQMLLNGGHYGGITFFSPQTVQYFTTRHAKSSRRGLGFDIKELTESKSDNMANLASDETFGHIGFTGSATFADPENQIVFTFLSNRTFPTMANNTMHLKKYRIKLQNIVYKSIIP